MSQTPAPIIQVDSLTIYHILNHQPPGSAAGNAVTVQNPPANTTYRWQWGSDNWETDGSRGNGNTTIQFSGNYTLSIASAVVTDLGNAFLAGEQDGQTEDAFSVYVWAHTAGMDESAPVGAIVWIYIIRDYEQTASPSVTFNNFSLNQPIDVAGYTSLTCTPAFVSPPVTDVEYTWRMGDGNGGGLTNGNLDPIPFVASSDGLSTSATLTVSELGRSRLQNSNLIVDAFSVYCWAKAPGMDISEPTADIVHVDIHAVNLNAVWVEQCNITSSTTENCTIHFIIDVNADYSLEYCTIGSSAIPFGENFTYSIGSFNDGFRKTYNVTVANSLGPVPAINGYIMLGCTFNYLAGTSRVHMWSNQCWFTPTVPPTPTISISPTQICASTGTYISTSCYVAGVSNLTYGIDEVTGGGSYISNIAENVSTASFSFSPQKPSGSLVYYRYYPMVSGRQGSVSATLFVQIGEYITTINILPTTGNAPALNLHYGEPYGSPVSMNITAQFLNNNCTLSPKGHFTKNTPGIFQNETDESVTLSTGSSWVEPGNTLWCNIGYVPNYDVESTTVVPAEYRIINQGPNLELVISTSPDISSSAGRRVTVGTPFTSNFAVSGDPSGTLHWEVEGSIPPGLADIIYGRISGIPTLPPTNPPVKYDFTLKVHDDTIPTAKSGSLPCTIWVDMPTFSGHLTSISPDRGPTGPTTTHVTISGSNCNFNSATDTFKFQGVSEQKTLSVTSWSSGDSVSADTPEWTYPADVSLQLYRLGYSGAISDGPTFHYFTSGSFVLTSSPEIQSGAVSNSTNTIVSGSSMFSTISLSGASPVGHVNWTVKPGSGNLPPGISINGIGSFSQTASVSGTCSSVGNYSFTLVASDSETIPQTGELPCYISVVAAPPIILSSDPDISSTAVANASNTILLGDSMVQSLVTASGTVTGVTSWTLPGNPLPTGIVLAPDSNSNNKCTVLGLPTTAGSYDFIIRISELAGQLRTADLSCHIEIVAAPPLTLSSSPDISSSANFTIIAGSTLPPSVVTAAGVPVGVTTWTIENETAPAWIVNTPSILDNYHTTISGTVPATLGPHNFTVRIIDSSGTPRIGLLNCTINVVAATPLTLSSSPNIASTAAVNSSNNLVVGTAMVASLVTAAGVPVDPTTWEIVNGSLPDGLVHTPSVLDNYHDTVSGTPTLNAVGSHFFSVKITDATRTAELPCHITVTDAPFSGRLDSIDPSSCLNTGGIVATIRGTGCHFNPILDSFRLQKGTRYEVLTVTSWTPIPLEDAVDVIIPNWGVNAVVDVHFLRVGSASTEPQILASLTRGFEYYTPTGTNSIVYSSPVSLIADTDFLDSTPLTITLENPAPSIDSTFVKLGTSSYSFRPSSVVNNVVTLNKANPNLYFHISDGDIYETGTRVGKPYTVGVRLEYPQPTGTMNLTADGYDIMVHYEPLSITEPTSLPVGNIGSTYPSTSIIATGGNNNRVWAIESGSFPPGLAFSSSGVITGSPTVVGTYNFAVRVACSQETVPPYADSTRRSYTISVTDPTASLVITTTSLADGRIGSVYSTDPANYIRATGRRTPYLFSVIENSPDPQENGPLPPGLSLQTDADVGIISGTPNSSCVVTTYPVHFKVTDASNPAYEADKWLNINILAAISTPVIDNMTPVRGPASGGIIVTINGSDFRSGIGVTFDGIPSLSVTRVGGGTTQLSVLLPAHPDLTDDKLVNVLVRNSDGGISPAKTFTYYIAREAIVTSVSPLDGPFDGGQLVYINGANLLGVTSIEFGIDASYESVDMLDISTTITDAQIICVSPTYTAPNPLNYKFVNIVLTKDYGDGLPPVTTIYPSDGRWTNIYGTEPTRTAEGYIYRPPPRITGVIPSQGPASGGNTIYITGDFFYCSRPLGDPPGVKIGDLDLNSDLITLVIG